MNFCVFTAQAISRNWRSFGKKSNVNKKKNKSLSQKNGVDSGWRKRNGNDIHSRWDREREDEKYRWTQLKQPVDGTLRQSRSRMPARRGPSVRLWRRPLTDCKKDDNYENTRVLVGGSYQNANFGYNFASSVNKSIKSPCRSVCCLWSNLI